MAHVEWTEAIRVGVPQIDAEHRHLLDRTNEFLTAAQKQAPLSSLSRILSQLITETAAHFQAEETLLDRSSYPQLAAHHAEHERLMTEARKLHERFEAPGRAEDIGLLTLETADYLQRWLVDHILVHDRPFRPYVMRLF
ncbi:conserved hypothetical protein [Candidatus Terasakiella magnetica]|nr:conserved hypothetical protein [Candidatus Terasakiella magnetica]